MLYRTNSVIFQINEPCTCAFCTFWGVGSTPKSPSGRHASVGMTQQSERLALTSYFRTCICVDKVEYLCPEKTIDTFCSGG